LLIKANDIIRCVKTVPFYKSIACSTDYALEWDESFKSNQDDSGRAVLGIHKYGRQVLN